MPEQKMGENRSAKPESDLKKMQQRLVAEAVDESFPASDPPAWTTTGSKSMAAQVAEPDRNRDENRADEGMADQASRLAERVYEAGRHYWNEAQERFPEAQRYVEQGRRYLRDAQERFPEAQRYVEQGRRYMEQGRHVVARPVASYPLTAVLVAGAAGFGLAWWIYGGSRSSGGQVPSYGKRQRYGHRPSMTPAERQGAEAHLAAPSRAAGAAGATPNSF